jgi:ribosomal protein S18 acetylase RimI-like enzyme
MKVIEPKSKEEFEKYYDLRWKILRKPWNQPRGSEKDELENKSIHLMALEGSQILGAGRGHFNTDEEAQIRYMAVEENQQGKGVGKTILIELEKKLKEKGAKYIVLNARETAVDFYKKNGYSVVEKSHTLFGSIPHFKMRNDFS